MDMVNSQGGASRGREELQTEFCSVFLFDFFPGVQMGGPRFVAGAGAAFGPSAPSVGPDRHQVIQVLIALRARPAWEHQVGRTRLRALLRRADE